MAFFEISEAAPLYLFPAWREATTVAALPRLRSRDLTRFTERVGRLERERLAMAQAWTQQCSEVKAIVFDSTSVSCYAEGLDSVEGGYNRDEASLPQINLGILYAEHNQLPLYYQLYPGSIPDVTTLKNLVHYLELFPLKERLLVLDRGFYSASNLCTMDQTPIKFMIPLSRSVKWCSTLLARNKRALANLTNSFVFGDQVFSHGQDTVEINQLTFQAQLYFNDRCRSEEVSAFLRKVLEGETVVQQHAFQPQEETLEYRANHSKSTTAFFQIKTKNDQLKIVPTTNGLSQRIAKRGVTLRLTNHQDLDGVHLLAFYRPKDYLEKTFDVLKNEFDGKRLQGHSKDVINGRLLSNLIGLIVYSALTNKMREKALFKPASIREIRYALKKLRIVEMNNGTSYLTEISKRQRELYSKLGVKPPVIGTSLLNREDVRLSPKS